MMEIPTEMENVWHEGRWSRELILDGSESLFELKLFSPFVCFFFVFVLVFSFWYLEILVFIFVKCVFLFKHLSF